jgi:hypothetical protein
MKTNILSFFPSFLLACVGLAQIPIMHNTGGTYSVVAGCILFVIGVVGMGYSVLGYLD